MNNSNVQLNKVKDFISLITSRAQLCCQNYKSQRLIDQFEIASLVQSSRSAAQFSQSYLCDTDDLCLVRLYVEKKFCVPFIHLLGPASTKSNNTVLLSQKSKNTLSHIKIYHVFSIIFCQKYQIVKSIKIHIIGT